MVAMRGDELDATVLVLPGKVYSELQELRGDAAPTVVRSDGEPSQPRSVTV